MSPGLKLDKSREGRVSHTAGDALSNKPKKAVSGEKLLEKRFAAFKKDIKAQAKTPEQKKAAKAAIKEAEGMHKALKKGLEQLEKEGKQQQGLGIESPHGNKWDMDRLTGNAVAGVQQVRQRRAAMAPMPVHTIGRTPSELVSEVVTDTTSVATDALAALKHDWAKVSSDLERALNTLKNAQPTLEVEHEVGGQKVGKEVCTRFDTVYELRRGYERELAYIDTLPQPLSPQMALRKAYVQKKLAQVVKQQDQGLQWITADKVRENAARFHSGASSESAQERYLPALTNARSQELVGQGDLPTTKFHRSGAITDHSDGTTNLRDLRKNAKDPAAEQRQEDLATLQKQLAQVDELIREAHAVLADKYQYFDHDIVSVNLPVLQEERAGLLEKIQKIEKVTKASPQATERAFILSDQMRQLVQHQVAGMEEELADPNSVVNKSGILVIGQVSLTDPQTVKTKDGIVMNERNQMLDMAEIFKDFRGKKVIFDVDDKGGSYIDAQGHLHMGPPMNDENDDPKVLELRPIFASVSVQGQKADVGEQREINEQALDDISDLLYDPKYAGALAGGDQQPVLNLRLKLGTRLSEIRSALANTRGRPPEDHIYLQALKGKQEDTEASNYKIAQDIACLMKDVSAAVGISCFSGKDRTGYMGVLMIYESLKASISKIWAGATEETREECRQTVAKQMWDDKGVLRQVIRQNTGFTVIKVHEPALKGRTNQTSRVIEGLYAGKFAKT